MHVLSISRWLIVTSLLCVNVRELECIRMIGVSALPLPPSPLENTHTHTHTHTHILQVVSLSLQAQAISLVAPPVFVAKPGADVDAANGGYDYADNVERSR